MGALHDQSTHCHSLHRLALSREDYVS